MRYLEMKKNDGWDGKEKTSEEKKETLFLIYILYFAGVHIRQTIS
jgi:hypothetical protein